MSKDELGKALSETSVRPVLRTSVDGQEVFVADGFLPPAQLKYLSRFGMSADADEYPFGAFVTIWYRDGKIGFGGIALCDVFHDMVHSQEARQEMRVKTAVNLARRDLAKRRKAH